MNHHQFLNALICVLLGVLLMSACSSPLQPTALLTTVAATAISSTATAMVTTTPIPPTPTSTSTSMPPTATLDPLMGRIEGKVSRSDTSQPFAETTVLLRDESYNVLLSTSTDTQGYYIFPSIEPGKYGVSVELSFTHPVLSGCKTIEQTGTDWLFVTEVKNGQIELTGVDTLGITVAAGEIIEKSLTLTCE